MFAMGPGLFKPPASGGDPYFGNVVALLHFDGPNGSTTFTDQKGNTWTPTGASMAISTTQSKFGGASGFWNVADSDYISSPAATWNDIGSGNFTVECWVYPLGSTDRSVISQRNSGASGWAMEVRSTGAVWIRGLIDGTYSDTRITTATGLVSNSTWTHIAFVRNGAVYTLYINGVSSGSLTTTGAGNMDTSWPIRMGQSQSATENNYNGYIDDMRITKGIARYTANFTPPTSAFPNS